MAWLTPFAACFGHRAQAVALGHYTAGLLSDSPRKSMQAMLARLTDPPAYQSLQHFITHAPWSAASMWRVLRARVPERRGILLLDDTGFPKKGDQSVGVARQVLGQPGQNRQLPSGRDRGPLDRRPRVAARRGAVSARELDQRCGAVYPRRDPHAGAPQEEVGTRAHLASGDPRRGRPPDRRPQRFRLWRCDRVPHRLAPPEAALWPGHFSDADRLCRPPRLVRSARRPGRPATPPPRHARRRHPRPGHRADAGRFVAHDRMAADHVALRRPARPRGDLCRGPGHPGARLDAHSAPAGDSGCSASAPRTGRA